MTETTGKATEDQPLDPAIERVRVRLKMLMLIAMGTLGLGLAAVVFAIVYKINHGDGRSATGAPWQSVIEVASKGTIVSTSLDGDRVAFLIEGPEGRILEVHDARSGALVGRSVLISK